MRVEEIVSRTELYTIQHLVSPLTKELLATSQTCLGNNTHCNGDAPGEGARYLHDLHSDLLSIHNCHSLVFDDHVYRHLVALKNKDKRRPPGLSCGGSRQGILEVSIKHSVSRQDNALASVMKTLESGSRLRMKKWRPCRRTNSFLSNC